jgi:C4-dicarboxylate-specific signal transduction histidine kinase
VRSIFLNNLRIHLLLNEEHQEAICCQSEAVALCRLEPRGSDLWVAFGLGLAHAHLMYAKHLHGQGENAAARAQLQAAAAALPPLDIQRWRTFSYAESYNLDDRRDVLMGLGRWAEARQVAAVEVLRYRAERANVSRHGKARAMLSGLYYGQENWRRAIAHSMRALAIWRCIGNHDDGAKQLELLSEVYAKTGDFINALSMRKELSELNIHRRREASALRCRLAAVERQAEQRRYRADEALAHAQRLGLIGRLIGQIHHALAEPIAQARQLTRQAQALNLHGAQSQALRIVMAELGLAIDRAGALVQQLKLFSYRSMPEPTVLPLEDALRQAWEGLTPHLGSNNAALKLAGDVHLQVRSDPQRLIILLTVMLIELLRRPPVQAADEREQPSVIHACVTAGQAGEVVLELGCRGCASSSASLGMELCTQIAHEMGGLLRTEDEGPAMTRYRLLLPEAQDGARS